MTHTHTHTHNLHTRTHTHALCHPLTHTHARHSCTPCASVPGCQRQPQPLAAATAPKFAWRTWARDHPLVGHMVSTIRPPPGHSRWRCASGFCGAAAPSKGLHHVVKQDVASVQVEDNVAASPSHTGTDFFIHCSKTNKLPPEKDSSRDSETKTNHQTNDSRRYRRTYLRRTAAEIQKYAVI